MIKVRPIWTVDEPTNIGSEHMQHAINLCIIELFVPLSHVSYHFMNLER